MLGDVLTVSYLRTRRDPEGVTRSEAETVTVDLSDISDPNQRALAALLARIQEQVPWTTKACGGS